jgi:hypothetical protein
MGCVAAQLLVEWREETLGNRQGRSLQPIRTTSINRSFI